MYRFYNFVQSNLNFFSQNYYAKNDQKLNSNNTLVFELFKSNIPNVFKSSFSNTSKNFNTRVRNNGTIFKNS